MAFTTLNPLDKTSGITLSAGNLTMAGTTGDAGCRAVDGFSTGKFYFNTLLNQINTGDSGTGICTAGASLTGMGSAAAGAVIYFKSSNIWVNGSQVASGSGAISTVVTLEFAVDLGGKLFWGRKVGDTNWNGSGTANPATGVGGLSFSALTGPFFPVGLTGNAGDNYTFNFGATAFTGTAPSGFVGWPGTVTTTSRSSFIITMG